MNAHFENDQVTLLHGSCLDVMRELPDQSVHSVVTDPPYGLANTDPAKVADAVTRWISGERDFLPAGKGFMNKAWDAFVPPPAVWDEALRVLKPGGYLLAFAGSRTFDLMSLSIRLAGFDIRDSIAWLYGSGFPKSLDVSEAMEKYIAEGPQFVPGRSLAIREGVYEVTAFLRAARDAAGWSNGRIDAMFGTNGMAGHWTTQGTQPAVPSVRQWSELKAAIGFGDEMDELVERLASTERPEDWGSTGGDGGKFLQGLEKNADPESAGDWGTALKPAFEPVVMARKPISGTVAANILTHGTGALNIGGARVGTAGGAGVFVSATGDTSSVAALGDGLNGAKTRDDSERGRWPSNVMFDESQAAELDRQAPKAGASGRASGPTLTGGSTSVARGKFNGLNRPATFHDEPLGGASRFFYVAKAPTSERPEHQGTMHATVKPLDLMQRLVKLVTPPGGIVLEPFAGSGTTVEACLREGFHCIAIEREADYLPLIMKRVRKDHPQSLFGDDWDGAA